MVRLFGLSLKFRGNLIAGFGFGVFEEITKYSDAEITDADLNRKMVENCLPVSNWFTETGYNRALKAMRNGDYNAAFKNLDEGALSDKHHVCIWLFKTVIHKIIKGCPQLLTDALPGKYY